MAVAAGALGLLLRLRQWGMGQSFWLDEALLAQNIVNRSPGGLLDPLDGNQGAPVGFLLVLDGFHAIFGLDERWLRLTPFLAGVALLPLVWMLGRRLHSGRVGALAVAFVAVSPGLIRYSAELKQYSSDAAICTALVVLALGRARQRWFTMAAAGAVAIWLSHPAILVLAGIGLVRAVSALWGRRSEDLVPIVATGATWAGSFGLLYLVSLRDLTENEFLTDYWKAGYPSSLGPLALTEWTWSNTTDVLAALGGHPFPALVALAVGVGALMTARRRPWDLATLLGFIPFLTVAAALHAYPYRGRLALFALPVLAVLLSSVADAPERWRGLAIGTLGIVLLGPTLEAADGFTDPLRFPDAAAAVAFIQDNVEPEDAIYVHGPGSVPFRLYTSDTDTRPTGSTGWFAAAKCPPVEHIDDLTGRAWFFFAYTHSSRPENEKAVILSQLDTAGTQVALYTGHDAFAALYDLDAPPDDPAGVHRLQTPTTGCLRVRQR